MISQEPYCFTEPLFVGCNISALEDPDYSETVFTFIKPHIKKKQARGIQREFKRRLLETEESFIIVTNGLTRELLESFWIGHYGHITEEAFPEKRRMIFEFSCMYRRGILFEVIRGKRGITTHAREVLGDKKYEKAEEGTIRNLYGHPDMGFNTIMHVSDLERVEYELENMRKHRII